MRTVSRWLQRLGLSRIRDLTPDGQKLRLPGMIHLDVKKVRESPNGGGWGAHGRGSEKALASKRAHQQKLGYAYLHSMIDGLSRLTYTEVLDDEKAATTIAFFHHARVFFAAHGMERITRVVTDNGMNYRAKDFTRTVGCAGSRHQQIRPYTPRHNRKVERYQRIIVDERLYARDYGSEAERGEAIAVLVHHYNYHRPHTACGDQPPASHLCHQRHDQLHLGALAPVAPLGL